MYWSVERYRKRFLCKWLSKWWFREWILKRLLEMLLVSFLFHVLVSVVLILSRGSCESKDPFGTAPPQVLLRRSGSTWRGATFCGSGFSPPNSAGPLLFTSKCLLLKKHLVRLLRRSYCWSWSRSRAKHALSTRLVVINCCLHFLGDVEAETFVLLSKETRETYTSNYSWIYTKSHTY